MKKLSFCETASIWGSNKPKAVPGTMFSCADVTKVSDAVTEVSNKTASIHVNSFKMICARLKLRNDPDLIGAGFLRDSLKLREYLKQNDYKRIAITGPLASKMFVGRERIELSNNTFFAVIIPAAFIIICVLTLPVTIIWSLFTNPRATPSALKFLVTIIYRAVFGYRKHYVIDLQKKLKPK